MAHESFEHHNMVPGPAGVAAVQVVWKTEDGILASYGNTVPTDGTSGYSIGSVFKHVDGSGGATLYVNEGSATVSDFNLVITEDNIDAQALALLSSATVNSLVADNLTTANTKVLVDAAYVKAGTAAGAGPSPLIWDAANLLEVILDPTQGFYYFNDYLGTIDVTTADGYVITAVNTGGITPVATEDGGVLLVDSQGNGSADDGVNVQLTNCMFKPVAGRTIRFEARVKFNDTSALISQFAIGLAGVDTTLIAAGVLDDTVDKCLWFRHGATTADKMSVCTARTSAEDIDADKATVADATYIKLGFVIDGLTSVKWYADGVLVHTSSVTANIGNAVMCLSYVAQTEGASKDAEMSVDWVRILQEGTRTA